MKRSDLKGKRVTVFGLGLSGGGTGTVEFLAAEGVREIIVTDKRKREDLLPSVRKLSQFKNVRLVLGQHRPEDFTRTDMVIRNPGIPKTNEYVRLAEKAGVPVEVDSGLFFSFCSNPIIGVTGTKGKTTTASMIAHILEESGVPVRKVGIGQTPVLGALVGIRPKDTVVFELSSWRLAGLERVKRSPHIAVFTNFFADHMNYYKDLTSYRKDKDFVYRFQKEGDTLVAEAGVGLSSEVPPAGVVRFFPKSETDGDGAFFRGDRAILRRDGEETVLFRREDLRVRGEQNCGNALAAAVAASVAGVPVRKIAAALRSFAGIPHRLEFVREVGGVSFYNDSASTVPEAAEAAIGAFGGNPILIAGGSDKNLPLAGLASSVIAGTKRTVLLRGDASDRLLREIRKCLPDEPALAERFPTASDMEEAVALARGFAEPGDVVVLSPGAASFGLFRNEFDRGDRFRDAIAGLPAR